MRGLHIKKKKIFCAISGGRAKEAIAQTALGRASFTTPFSYKPNLKLVINLTNLKLVIDMTNLINLSLSDQLKFVMNMAI